MNSRSCYLNLNYCSPPARSPIPARFPQDFWRWHISDERLLNHPNDPQPVHPRFRSLDAPVCASWDHLRSEEHTSELQSRENLVCRLLLEKKKQKKQYNIL